VRILAASMMFLVASTMAASAFTRSMCNSLWVERTSIYKDAGLCFKTERALQYFGNFGCRYDHELDVPLTPREIARLEQLRAQERALRCEGWSW